MKMLRPAVAALTVVLFANCSSTPRQSSTILEVEESAVADCSLVGEVAGRFPMGDAMKNKALESARAQAVKEAQAKGATHIVWTDVKSTASFGAIAEGKAYRCGG